jgi:hypothetical protein
VDQRIEIGSRRKLFRITIVEKEANESQYWLEKRVVTDKMKTERNKK